MCFYGWKAFLLDAIKPPLITQISIELVVAQGSWTQQQTVLLGFDLNCFRIKSNIDQLTVTMSWMLRSVIIIRMNWMKSSWNLNFMRVDVWTQFHSTDSIRLQQPCMRHSLPLMQLDSSFMSVGCRGNANGNFGISCLIKSLMAQGNPIFREPFCAMGSLGNYSVSR